MKYGVHIASFVHAIENCASDIRHAFSDNPSYCRWTNAVEQWFESNKHAQSHRNKAKRLEIAVVFQFIECSNRSNDCANPNENKQTPSPDALSTHRNQRDRRIRARDVPVDCCVIEATQLVLPARRCSERVVPRAGDVGAQHTKKIQCNANRSPCVVAANAPR